jgi:hypothetical protein
MILRRAQVDPGCAATRRQVCQNRRSIGLGMTTARSYINDLVDIPDGLIKIELLIEGMTLDRFVQ